MWPHLSQFDLIFSLRSDRSQRAYDIQVFVFGDTWTVYNASIIVNIKNDVEIDTVTGFAKHAGSHMIE